VSGPNVSPPAAWTNGANSAAPFTPAIAVTGPVALDAQLALVNGPAGLVRTHPIPPVHFAINDQRQANLAAHWQPELQFNDGARQSAFVVGTSHPRYVGASQTINVQGSMPAAPQHNPGLTLSIESRVERGGVVIAPARVAAWLPNAPESAVVTLVIAAPGAMPAAGDPISVVTRLLDATGAQVNVRATAMVVGQEATYLQPAAEARWNADEAHLHSAAAGGFVHFLAGAGGAAAGLANLIDRPGHPGPIIIHPMVQRHDSSAYVAAENAGVPDPSKAAYVIKTPPYLPHPDPAHTIVLPVGAGGWRIPANPAYPGAFILLSRTPDVTLGLPRRPDDELQIYAVHESTHLMDRPGAGPFEDYKTEFRAYWNDGRFGPPNQAVPASPDEFAAEFDPTTPTPGPKSRRANRIFHEMYDDPVLYSFCQPNYDGNVGGFRDQVDSYLVPDGVNLILSAHLEDLRTRFAVGVPAGFPAFRTMVQGFFGPPAPTLSAGERAYVKRSRAWRDLVDNLAGATAPEKATLKADMGIP
jgi:hypothetical protein